MKKILVTISLLLLLFSCSTYNEVLKSDDYSAKFELANELYERGKHLRSIPLYEQVYQKMPQTGEGELAYFRIGKSYYFEEDYYMAGYFLRMFAQRFPDSPKAEEAFFLSALCAVQESPEPSLDQEPTLIAINDLQDFVDRFPNSYLVDSCNRIIDRLRFKIETKDFDAVKLYDKTMHYRAAVNSGLTFKKEYPMSVFLPENEYLIVKNSFLLAKNSVYSKKMKRIDDAIKRYLTFVSQYPDSKHQKELKGLYEMILKEKEDFENKIN